MLVIFPHIMLVNKELRINRGFLFRVTFINSQILLTGNVLINWQLINLIIILPLFIKFNLIDFLIDFSKLKFSLNFGQNFISLRN